jgi:nucleoside-diphosphate-sugar epimerase
MTGPDFTILGCGGTIGTALTAALCHGGYRVQAVDRAALPGLLASGRPAGHVISCIGLTGDFRTRPLDCAEAHVGMTARCLALLRCESFLYLSSTRVYIRAASTHEDAPLPCVPTDPSDLYTLTKLTGEALCLADRRAAVRVVRLSNVYGATPGTETFLGQVIAAGRSTGRVLFQQAPESEKDYVSMADAVRLLPEIAASGRHRLYTLAAGHNASHRDIAAILSTTLGWHTGFLPNAPTIKFQPIEAGRLREEFQAPARIFTSDLARLAAGQDVSIGVVGFAGPCSQLHKA